ncbi:MAG: hypothetical protein ABFD46_08425 [Armatimonadota bacterium]
MDLENIDLSGLGAFTTAKGGFRVDKYHLEEPWSYIYTTDRLLLKVDQHGPDFIQFSPPGGTLLVKRERFQTWPSLFTWIKTSENKAFTNFYLPIIGCGSLSSEPEQFHCGYNLGKAAYTVGYDSLLCVTELFVPKDDAVVVMTCTITNMDATARKIELFPVMRPHMAAAALEPWDIPALYQKVAYSNDRHPVFYIELRHPNGSPEMREYSFLLTDIENPTAETNYDDFTGQGTFENPEILHGKPLRIGNDAKYHFGNWTAANSTDGQQGIAALGKNLLLNPSESFTFTTVIGSVDVDARGKKPEFEEIMRFEKYLKPEIRASAVIESQKSIEEFLDKRTVATPDEPFNRYINEWLPLQLNWVTTLDRGWPTAMRGTRDCSQDRTGLIPLDPLASRKSILDILGCQRSDGWFLRQFSTSGKHGKHDHRPYMDGGLWVWVLIYEYLCRTKDFAILTEEPDWLDSDEKTTVIRHIIKGTDWYLATENIGEHGLCKIRGGDWNDSINQSGCEGRGETAMGTCQAVVMLKQSAELYGYLAIHPEIDAGIPAEELKTLAAHYGKWAETLKDNLLEHALNDEGYLNGVFLDSGKWLFSANDPDGRRRVNIPANAYGMISGVLEGENFERALKMLLSIRTEDGYPLYYPAIGEPPIEKVGRIGMGDLGPGLGENGAIYNHGSHGFFARGVARHGQGDLVLELMEFLCPYDQSKHPVSRAKAAPYGVPNQWRTAPGQEGRAGTCFLSGSISTGLRAVYNGMFGIIPMLDGLAIDPDLPSTWKECSVDIACLSADLHIIFRQAGNGNARLTFNGKEVYSKRKDVLLDKEVFIIPDAAFEPGRHYEIVWEK